MADPRPSPVPAAAAAGDPLVEVAETVLKAALVVVLVVVGAPLLLPAILLAVLPLAAADKTRFWVVPRWWTAAVVAGPLLVAVLLMVEVLVLPGRIRQVPDAALPVRAAGIWAACWPWLAGNLAAGILLIPASFTLRRQTVARLVQQRRIPDVVTQERIEKARKQAADLAAAARIGVRLTPGTGQIRQVSSHAITAPHLVAGQPAFGVLSRPTVATLSERLRDRRQVRDWVSRNRRWVQLPAEPGTVRAMVVAESGAGKTILLHGLVHAALSRGWPVVVIDGKGDPADAAALAGTATAAGHTATVATAWRLFAGTSEQVLEKLMRLLPPPDGANQHYLDETRAVLAAIQTSRPLTSPTDLRDRLTDPRRHLNELADLELLEQIVEPRSGLTAAGRAMRALSTVLRPIEAAISPDGWSYRALTHDLTVVPLAAARTSHARLGDLMLLDLRHTLTDRLDTGDKTPLLVVVDEFAQLTGPGIDPGDSAAALFETARSAGTGLVLAAQSTAGLTTDDTRRARVLASGAALILGRSKNPDDAVHYAGSVMQMEASGAAAGQELRSARAQHTWVVPPQDIREAWDGAFWLIQAGNTATFRALPTRPAPPDEHDPYRRSESRSVPTGPVPALETTPAAAPPPTPAVPASTPAGPGTPTPRVPRSAGIRRPARVSVSTPSSVPRAVPSRAVAIRAAATGTGVITGLEIEVRHLGDQQWLAIAYPATDDEILNDLPEPTTAVFTCADHPTEARFGAWSDQWHPAFFTRWNPDSAPLPTAWAVVLNELVDTARRRHHL